MHPPHAYFGPFPGCTPLVASAPLVATGARPPAPQSSDGRRWAGWRETSFIIHELRSRRACVMAWVCAAFAPWLRRTGPPPAPPTPPPPHPPTHPPTLSPHPPTPPRPTHPIAPHPIPPHPTPSHTHSGISPSFLTKQAQRPIHPRLAYSSSEQGDTMCSARVKRYFRHLAPCSCHPHTHTCSR